MIACKPIIVRAADLASSRRQAGYDPDVHSTHNLVIMPGVVVVVVVLLLPRRQAPDDDDDDEVIEGNDMPTEMGLQTYKHT